MNKKYIDAEKLLSNLKALPEQQQIEYLGIYDCIKSSVADDVGKTGTWVSDDCVYYYCSECGYKQETPERVTDFCPKCGAKMSNRELLYMTYAKHAIGLDYKNSYHRHGKAFYRPYRNYFCTNIDNEIWKAFEDAGYAIHDDEEHDDCVTFHLTRAGLDWLGDRLKISIFDY